MIRKNGFSLRILLFKSWAFGFDGIRKKCLHRLKKEAKTFWIKFKKTKNLKKALNFLEKLKFLKFKISFSYVRKLKTLSDWLVETEFFKRSDNHFNGTLFFRHKVLLVTKVLLARKKKTTTLYWKKQGKLETAWLGADSFGSKPYEWVISSVHSFECTEQTNSTLIELKCIQIALKLKPSLVWFEHFRALQSITALTRKSYLGFRWPISSCCWFLQTTVLSM